MPSGVSPEPIRLVPDSVSNAQLLGGQVAATPELSSNHPPAVCAATLHELWCEFGDTVNGAKTKGTAAARRKASEIKYKAREAVVLRLPPFPRQITGVTLNFTLSSVSPDIPSLLPERESPAKPVAPHKETHRRVQQLRFMHFI